MSWWAIKHPNGNILVRTLQMTREEAYFALFDFMPERFRSTYWKRDEESRRQYPRLGFKAVRVRLVEETARPRAFRCCGGREGLLHMSDCPTLAKAGAR